jgi:hypothetical protein
MLPLLAEKWSLMFGRNVAVRRAFRCLDLNEWTPVTLPATAYSGAVPEVAAEATPAENRLGWGRYPLRVRM